MCTWVCVFVCHSTTEARKICFPDASFATVHSLLSLVPSIRPDQSVLCCFILTRQHGACVCVAHSTAQHLSAGCRHRRRKVKQTERKSEEIKRSCSLYRENILCEPHSHGMLRYTLKLQSCCDLSNNAMVLRVCRVCMHVLHIQQMIPTILRDKKMLNEHMPP